MNGYTQNKRPLQSITYLLLSTLFLFTLTLTQPAFASDSHSMAVSATPTSASTSTAPTDKGFALARVSVVRLLFSYVTDSNGTPVATCIGLGVLVKSWQASGGTELNNWVLTDGFLLDVTNSQVTCAGGHLKGQLAGVQVSLNTAFNGTEQRFSASTDPVCVDQTKCLKGPALVGFHSDAPLPFVDLAALPVTSGKQAIALTKDGAQAQPPLPSGDLTPILTPQLFPLNTPNLEAGTPLINAAGRIYDLHAENPGVSFLLSDMLTLITTKIPNMPSPLPANTVNTNWNKGIDDFYNKNYIAAQADFQSVVTANPNFQGASDFANFAKAQANTAPPPSNNQPTGGGFVLPFINVPLDLWSLSVLGLLFLAVVFLLGTLIIRPRVQRYRAEKAEIEDADRRAELVIQQIKELEAKQRDWLEHHRVSTSPTQSSANLTPKVEFDATDIRADINASQLMQQEGR